MKVTQGLVCSKLKYGILQYFIFYVIQGQSGWGKFIWFYVLTSEIDNLCNIKENPNYFLPFGKAYECKLADIEKTFSVDVHERQISKALTRRRALSLPS